MKYVDYLTWSKDKLLLRYCELSEELASVYTELGYTKAQEFSVKGDRWGDSRETTVHGRENDVRYATPIVTVSIIELDYREKSLQVERDLIFYLLEWEGGDA